MITNLKTFAVGAALTVIISVIFLCLYATTLPVLLIIWLSYQILAGAYTFRNALVAIEAAAKNEAKNENTNTKEL